MSVPWIPCSWKSSPLFLQRRYVSGKFQESMDPLFAKKTCKNRQSFGEAKNHWTQQKEQVIDLCLVAQFDGTSEFLDIFL